MAKADGLTDHAQWLWNSEQPVRETKNDQSNQAQHLRFIAANTRIGNA